MSKKQKSKTSGKAAQSPKNVDEHHSIFALTKEDETIVDKYFNKLILKPLLPKIPRSLHPNTISIVNSLICWFAVFFAFRAVEIEKEQPTVAFVMRIFTSILLFISLAADCLDGLHARKTNQCSKLGEILDHSLDAANAVLISSSILILFYHSVPVIVSAYSMPATAFIYNAQLVIYEREAAWIVPPVSGTHAQLLVIAGQTAMAFLLFFVGRDAALTWWILNIFAVFAILTQVKDQFYYGRYLTSGFERNHFDVHLRYILISAAFALLLVVGLISWEVFIYGNILISWRLNGRYLIRIVIASSKKEKENQNQKSDLDHGFNSPLIIGGIVLLAIAGLSGNPFYKEVSAWVFCLSLAGLSLFELYVNLPTIKKLEK